MKLFVFTSVMAPGAPPCKCIVPPANFIDYVVDQLGKRKLLPDLPAGHEFHLFMTKDDLLPRSFFGVKTDMVAYLRPINPAAFSSIVDQISEAAPFVEAHVRMEDLAEFLCVQESSDVFDACRSNHVVTKLRETETVVTHNTKALEMDALISGAQAKVGVLRAAVTQHAGKEEFDAAASKQREACSVEHEIAELKRLRDDHQSAKCMAAVLTREKQLAYATDLEAVTVAVSKAKQESVEKENYLQAAKLHKVGNFIRMLRHKVQASPLYKWHEVKTRVDALKVEGLSAAQTKEACKEMHTLVQQMLAGGRL